MHKGIHKALLLTGLALVFAGCNKSETKESGGTEDPKGKPAGKSASVPAPGDSQQPTVAVSGAKSQWEVYTDEDGRKWFGKVPYDVFFEDPLGVANDSEPIIGATTNPPPDGGPDKAADPKPEDPPPAESEAAGKWSDLITAEALDAEVKAIRNFLNPRLQSVGQYNSNLAMIPTQAATLAALAAVAAEHDGDISWKADALYIRDLAGAMNEEPLQRGPRFQRKLLELFEQISDTLNRSRPADLEEPDPEADIVDSAEMRLLMKRMDDAYNEMKTNAGSEDSFRSSFDMVRQQSAVLATLAKVVTKEGYGYEDDEEFIALAQKVYTESVKMNEAAAAEAFSEYDTALSLAYQACNQCHMDYKN